MPPSSSSTTTPLPPRAAVSYKKKDGHLSLSDDRKFLFWTAASPPNASPAVTIPVLEITNLQQTPKTSPKVALKVVVKDENHLFSFMSKEHGRKEQEAVTEALSNEIAARKADAAAAQLAPAAGPKRQRGDGDEGQSAAMAMAKAVSSKAAAAAAEDGWYDDNKLKADHQLQRSLLESDRALSARFQQALNDRPESVSVSQFTTQFWSARLHLLRAHAIEKAQRQGEYNVLPEIRFTRKAAEKEGEPDIKQLNITKEQIKLIFKQYPVVSEAYNENVPPLDPGQFWQRFFGSRLLKNLKGERFTPQDPPDSVLDRYLDRRERGPGFANAHIPHFIDLEGNEQNHSQRKGNRPDQDMRPSSFDKVPILRVLNNLSEKMLSHVAPEDGEAHAPIGLDEDAFERLRLRDLATDDADNRVHLNIKEQERYLGGDERELLSADAKKYARQDPRKVLDGLSAELRPEKFGSDERGTLRLDRVVGFHSDDDDDDSESGEDDSRGQTNGASRPKPKPKHPQTGSRSSLRAASSSILASIAQRRTFSTADPTSLGGLSQSLYDQLTITHNTTIEFLHYFWSVYLSGDAGRSSELAQLVSTLDRSLDRINAIGAAAETEREEKIETRRRKLREWEKETGKRRKIDVTNVPGGRKVVEEMLKPTVGALGRATALYRKALEEQTKEMEGGGAAAATGAVRVGGTG